MFALNEIYPELASLYRLWSRIPIIRILMKNYIPLFGSGVLEHPKTTQNEGILHSNEGILCSYAAPSNIDL